MVEELEHAGLWQPVCQRGDLLGRSLWHATGLDPVAAQVRADRPAGVRLVAQHPPGPGPGPSRPRRVTRSWPISGTRASESWRCPALVRPPWDRPGPPGCVTGRYPGGRTGVLSMAAVSRAGSTSAEGRAAPRPRAGVPGSPWRRLPPSTPALRSGRTRRASDPGSSPRSRPPTAAMPVIHRLLIPEACRQVPPRAPGPGPEEDPVNHEPVIMPPVSLPRMPRQ
jgi:hypothetical protein